MEMLCLLFDNKCPWNEETCSTTAMFGYMKILQWLRENGCPWDVTKLLKEDTWIYCNGQKTMDVLQIKSGIIMCT
jgi:hypothetical protein